MWRLFRITHCRFGMCLLLAIPLIGCDWDASSGGSSSRAVSDDDTTTPAAESDTTPPVVLATNPTDGHVDVARTEAITAEFDEDIIASSVTTDSFTVIRSSGAGVSGEVSFDATTNTASFTPEAPMAMLETHTATLGTQISDLSGNPLAEDYTWSFTAGDGEWKTAGLIESSNAGSARNPQVALDDSGRGIAVWEQFQGGRYKIWANRYEGSGWGTPGLIELDSGGAALSPQVAINDAGQAFAVWQQDSGARNNIWANRFDNGGWGTAELIQEDQAGDASAPQIAINDDGQALAVWQQSNGSGLKIWANRFNGSVWGTEVMIQPSEDAGSGNVVTSSLPKIVLDTNGRGLAVWLESNEVSASVWANRFDGTNWGEAEQIQVNPGADAQSPQIAITSDGEAIAVWAESDGFRDNIWANRFNGNSWGTAELIETDNAGTASAPQIALDDGGLAVAAWQQFDGSVLNIMANRFENGAWGGAELIETDGANSGRKPQVALDANGRALAVWEQFDGAQFRVWANRFDGDSWGEPELIETATGGSASVPQVALDAEGHGLSVWHQFDGARDNIWANRFE